MLGSMYKGIGNSVTQPPASALPSSFSSAVRGLINAKARQLKYVNESVAVAIIRFITRIQCASESLLTYEILSYCSPGDSEDNSTFELILGYLKHQSTGKM